MHQGVLNREQQQQQQVDGHRDRHRGARPLVNGLRYANTREEADGVAEYGQEEQVHRCRIHQDEQRALAGLGRSAAGTGRAGVVECDMS